MKSRSSFKFTGKERFFQGHFPEAPILPGVMQVQFAHEAAERLLGRPLVLKAVKKMKFVRIVEPGMPVDLEVESFEKDSGVEVAYRFVAGESTCSSGILCY